MLTPKWIGLLILAIVLAGGFVALSHWQLSRSIATAEFANTRDTETVRALNTALAPGAPMHDKSDQVMVRTQATPVANSMRLIRDRKGDNGPVYWVVGAVEVRQSDNTDAILAMVWGQSVERPNLTQVAAAIGNTTRTVTGRLYKSESPQPILDSGRLPNVVSIPQLVGQWQTPLGTQVYSAFVVDGTASAGLDRVPIPAPAKELQRNMLNVFYAIEWVFFAGFAIFLWGRLVVDDYRREQEYLELEARSNPVPGKD